MLMLSFIFFEGYDDHRDLHVLTRSLPTRRSSELEVQRVAQIGRERVIRPGAFLLRNAPSARVQIEAVAIRGIIGERGVALGLHPRDDRTDVGGNIGIALAPTIDQRVALGREAGFGSIKPPHRRRSRNSGARKSTRLHSSHYC